MKKRSILFNSCLTYFIVILCFVLMRVLVLTVDLPISDDILDIISTIIVQMGLMFLLPIFLYSLLSKQKTKKTFNDFKFKKINFTSVAVCVFIGFLCFFLNLAIASFFESVIGIFGYESSPSFASTAGDYSVLRFFLNVLMIAILPAICEETAHRGLLLNGFSSLGIKSTVVMSSILFGLMHLNINQFFYATILGFIIAVSVVISKSIFPAMIIHFMNNFLSVYFSFADKNDWLGNTFYQFMKNFLYSNNLISFFATVSFLLLILLIAIIFLFSILLKETRIRNVKNMLADIAKINQEYYAGNQNFQKNENFMNLHSLNDLMVQYNIKNLNSMVFTDLESRSKKPTQYEKVLMIGCFVVGIIITAFTFVWGMI